MASIWRPRPRARVPACAAIPEPVSSKPNAPSRSGGRSRARSHVPWPGGDRAGFQLRPAALACVIAIGQAAGPGVLVTIPLHQTEAHPADRPCAAVITDGRFVAFVTVSALVAADTNRRDDIY